MSENGPRFAPVMMPTAWALNIAINIVNILNMNTCLDNSGSIMFAPITCDKLNIAAHNIVKAKVM